MANWKYVHLKPQDFKGKFEFKVSYKGSQEKCPDCEFDKIVALNDEYAVEYEGLVYPKGALRLLTHPIH